MKSCKKEERIESLCESQAKDSETFLKVARQHAAVAHKLSNYVTKTFDKIIIEDVNVKGMIKNRKFESCNFRCWFWDVTAIH
jgi:putative transposase